MENNDVKNEIDSLVNINLEDIFYAFYKNGKIYTILKSNVNNL